VSDNRRRVEELLMLAGEMRLDDLIERFATDAVMELPFAPGRMEQRYVGRDAILGFQRFVHDAFSEFSMRIDAIHETSDPHVVIAEHRSDGIVAENGRRYQNRYITLFEFDDDGMIVLWREYYDAGAVVRAFRSRG
jgi:ketosteroid isomerase-like protein